jgi:xylulose-5-phosphate/fructose-6-phosphate phosphoketolase
MTVLNGLDRFHLVQSVIDRIPEAPADGGKLKSLMEAKLIEHHDYIRKHGQDMPEIINWRWNVEGKAPPRSN